MKPENVLQFSEGFTLIQLNPVLVSTFVSVCSNVNVLGENSNLNSNKEFILHPCQVVLFRSKPRGKCLYLCLVTGVQGQMAIHMADLMSLDRTVTKKYYIRV
jgi:hypothetical protein